MESLTNTASLEQASVDEDLYVIIKRFLFFIRWRPIFLPLRAYPPGYLLKQSMKPKPPYQVFANALIQPNRIANNVQLLLQGD